MNRTHPLDWFALVPIALALPFRLIWVALAVVLLAACAPKSLCGEPYTPAEDAEGVEHAC
jgi:hypothetical protein